MPSSSKPPADSSRFKSLALLALKNAARLQELAAQNESVADARKATAEMLAAAVDSWLVENPPRDGDPGEPGKDAPTPDPEQLAALCRESAEAWLEQHRDALRGEPGKASEPLPPLPPLEPLPPIEGDKGDKGDIGPMPRHEWEGTKLRFEVAPGQWGRWVDLRGPSGGGGGSTMGYGGGSSSPPSPPEILISNTVPVAPTANYLRFETDIDGDVQRIFLGSP